MKKVFYIYRYLILIAIVLPGFVYAQGTDPRAGLRQAAERGGIYNQGMSVQDLIGNLIKALLSLIGAIFFILILWSGFKWMTAQGNSEQLKQAKTTMSNAAIGLAIVFASYAITLLIFNVVLGNVGSGNGGGGVTCGDTVCDPIEACGQTTECALDCGPCS